MNNNDEKPQIPQPARMDEETLGTVYGYPPGSNPKLLQEYINHINGVQTQSAEEALTGILQPAIRNPLLLEKTVQDVLTTFPALKTERVVVKSSEEKQTQTSR